MKTGCAISFEDNAVNIIQILAAEMPLLNILEIKIANLRQA
jgi:hypothetical protein